MTQDASLNDNARIRTPITPAAVAGRIRDALDAADLAAFSDLLSPDVHWGAPGDPNPTCRNRDQVLKWYEKGRASGRRGTVTEVSVHGNAVLVGLRSYDGEDR